MSEPSHLIRIESHDEETTERVGEIIGEVVARPAVVALHGDLGAGKTRLVRGLARGLGLDADAISSPTFVVHMEHRGRDVALSHLDAYRLVGDEELENIGFDELLEDGDRLVAIEWPQRIERLASDRVDVRLDHRGPDLRAISVLDARPDDTERRRLREAFEARADAFVQALGQAIGCPSCGGDVAEARFRPFCSDRCRLADLEGWFGGGYTISRPLDATDFFEGEV